MYTSRIVAAIFISALTAGLLQAAETPPVPMLSGGIGEGEIVRMNTAEKDYNLKLVFADETGAYLAEVSVVIRDSKKEIVVNAQSLGPIVLITLKPGVYELTSTSMRGITKTESITVGERDLITRYVHLHTTVKP